MQSPPATTSSLAELLNSARAARDAADHAAGRTLAERAWTLAAQSDAAEEARAEAGHLLCLFTYRLGDMTALLRIGSSIKSYLFAIIDKR